MKKASVQTHISLILVIQITGQPAGEGCIKASRHYQMLHADFKTMIFRGTGQILVYLIAFSRHLNNLPKDKSQLIWASFIKQKPVTGLGR
ncbi:hypothetical protein [Bifidobacterium choladohabitans]|uniref:hypothetical protein n=1 Tax=Bifidobacterium choladohabitans TaxID=2750947 RepID=UPI0018DE8235|nr:hypothetical protein [Bifidobacterium choladohabitans]MBI0047661.1 hypothetical protein [Bifidobacterium choladohabitans]